MPSKGGERSFRTWRKAEKESAHEQAVAVGNWDTVPPGSLCGLWGFELQQTDDSTCVAKHNGLLLSLSPEVRGPWWPCYRTCH